MLQTITGFVLGLIVGGGLGVVFHKWVVSRAAAAFKSASMGVGTAANAVEDAAKKVG